MNLVRFLVIGCLITVLAGELGKFPFGNAGNSFSLLDLMVGITGVIFLTWKVGIKRELDYPRIFLVLPLFVLVGILSLVWNNDLSGGLYAVRLFFYSLLFWIGFDLTGKAEQLKKIIVSTGIGIVILGVLQLIIMPDLSFLTDYGYDPHIGRMTATFLDPNFLGAFLVLAYAVVVEFFVYQKSKVYFAAIGIFFLAIVLTFSRSAWIMFAIFNLFISFLLPKKITILIVIAAVSASLFIPRIQERLIGLTRFDITSQERVWSWQKGVELFQISPVIGIGFNNIRSVSVEQGLLKTFSENGGNSGSGVDSSLLLVLATTGVLGSAVYLTFFILILIYFLKAGKKTIKLFLIPVGLIISLLIESQFINSLFYPPIMLLFFLLMGIYYGQFKKNISK